MPSYAGKPKGRRAPTNGGQKPKCNPRGGTGRRCPKPNGY